MSQYTIVNKHWRVGRFNSATEAVLTGLRWEAMGLLDAGWEWRAV